MNNKPTLMATIKITNKLKVLYIEDSSESRIQAVKLFKNYFSDIDVAIDGHDGLRQYKNHFLEINSYYDLVITDIEMPKMNGIDMIKAIYTLNKNQKIVVLSAYNEQKYFIELINLGVDGFLQKPLSFEQVLDAMNKVSKSIKDANIIFLSLGCSYDKLLKKFICNGKKIHLTNNEQKFIELHIDNHLLSFTTKEIFNHIYYDTPQKEFSIDTIKGLVKRLRKKLPDDLILHNRTTGYSISRAKN